MGLRNLHQGRALGAFFLVTAGIAELVGFAVGVHCLQTYGWLPSEDAPCPRVHVVP